MDIKTKLEFKKLSWNNYQELQSAMDSINHEHKFSSLTMLGWNFYGIKIEYCIDQLNGAKIIYLFARFNRFIEDTDDVDNLKIQQILRNGDHFLINPIFDLNKINSYVAINQALKFLLMKYPVRFDCAIEGVSQNFLSQLKPDGYREIYCWNANFIYDLDKMRTFAGKKLQKKRNHYNYFLKTYAQSVIVKPIDHLADEKDILDFTKKMVYSVESDTRENELTFIRSFLKNFDAKTMKGTVIRTRSKNEIIAFTIGYIHNSTYEVFFEKAHHSWRGLYQFLIASNLKINGIQSKWMDRQDDASLENIYQSKMSYYPEEVFVLSMIVLNHKECDRYEKNQPITVE